MLLSGPAHGKAYMKLDVDEDEDEECTDELGPVD